MDDKFLDKYDFGQFGFAAYPNVVLICAVLHAQLSNVILKFLVLHLLVKLLLN